MADKFILQKCFLVFFQVKPPPNIDDVIDDIMVELADKKSLINVYRDNDERIEMTNIIFIYSDLVNNADDLPSNSSANMTGDAIQQIMDSGLKRIKVSMKNITTKASLFCDF